MQRLVLIILINILVGASSYAAYGPDNIVTIMQTSTTGKTVILNKGSSGNLEEDKLAVLLVPQKKNKKIIYKPVAKLKSVKIFDESSIWIAFKVYMPSMLEKSNKLILLDENNLLRGRKALSFQRSKVIANEKNVNAAVSDNLIESSTALSKKEGEYNIVEKLHDKEKLYDNDIDLVDIDVWEQKKGSKKKIAHSIYKSNYSKAFAMKHRLQTFEKMVVAFIRKYNDPKFTIARAYFQTKDPSNLIATHESSDYYTRFVENEDIRLKKEDKIYGDLRDKGESWSDDYSDEELSELVYNVGVIKERERRRTISAHHFSHQVYGNFGLNLVNNENLKDRTNTAQSKYDFEFGYEYFAFKDVDALDKVAFEFTMRRAVDAYSIGGGYNATSVEYSFTGGINWYPFKRPNSLDTNIIYAGLLIRSGISALEVSDTNEKGTYSILTIPGIRAGIKYNFSNSYGVRIFGGFENIKSSRIKKSSSSGVLPDVASYTEGKMGIGLSKFF